MASDDCEARIASLEEENRKLRRINAALIERVESSASSRASSGDGTPSTIDFSASRTIASAASASSSGTTTEGEVPGTAGSPTCEYSLKKSLTTRASMPCPSKRFAIA